MKTLRLSLIGNTWHCETVGDEAERDEVIRLFGTANLPTPFTAACPPSEVESRIQELNPGDTVLAGLL